MSSFTTRPERLTPGMCFLGRLSKQEFTAQTKAESMFHHAAPLTTTQESHTKVEGFLLKAVFLGVHWQGQHSQFSQTGW